MKHVSVLLAIVLAHLLVLSAAAGTIRIGAAVYRGNEADEALTDLLLVELSRQPQIEVLERRQLQMVLGELSLGALADDAWRQTRLGKLLGVDAFVWIRLRDDQAVLEVVEAATGRGIAVRQQRVAAADLVNALRVLAQEAVRAAREGPAAVDKNAPTLAIAKPIFEQPSDTLGQTVESALIALEQDLKQAGVTMLSRRFLEDLVLERWMMDKGLTSAQRQRLPMLGARYVLTVRVSKAAAEPVVSLLETRTGRRVGYRTWAPAEMRTDAGRAAMVEWIRRRIDPQSQQRSRPRTATPAKDDAPLQPETLAPFYRGVLRHNQGAYLDAAEQFREAMRRDQRFLEPYRWMQSCLVGAGFDEVSQAVGDYVDRARRDVWHGISSPKALHADPGVALIGVSTAPTVSASLGVPTTMLLIDAVHEATGVPVFVTADMAQLRDEFDALAGLENVVGTTWRQAPPMLFVDTLTGHLEPGAGGLRLRLCVTHRLDPGRIVEVTVDLPQNRRQWQKEIRAASRRLLDRAAASRPAWTRPALLLSEEDIPAAKLSFQEYTPLRYLKCVARDKEFVDNLRYPYNNDWFENVIMPGLHRWFVRTLPEQSKVRPVVEFAYVSYYESGADWPAAMEELGRKYPQDPVGMIARLNALLYRLDLDEDNLRQAQAKLEKLLAELEPHVSTTFSRTDLQRYRDTNRLLRRALGMPDERGRLRPGGRAYARLEYGSPITIRAGGTFPATLDFPGPQADMQQRALVDLAVLRCACRKERDIPVATVKGLFERFAQQPEVLAYFSVSYGNKIFSNRIQAPTEEELPTLTELYPAHARAVVALLRLEPLPYSRQEVGFLVGVHPWLRDFGAKHPAFRHARQQVKKAVLDAIIAGRFKKLTPLDVFALVIDVSPQGDPEVTPYLKQLADRSLAADPLEDRYWRVYAQWGQPQTPGARMARYLPFYERVRQLHPQPILNQDTAWWYFDFGLVFFRGGRFDLAEEVLSAIAGWEQPRALALSALKANTDYLLALIRQRERNIPEALRLAKRAVDETSDGTIGLITGIGIGGSRQGRGSTSNLKSLVTDLIARLRNDPNAPFEYPFDNRWQ
jgi:tetratricopeptide (TPR) repeat protein